MEIHININKDLSEDTVNFSIKEMTPELSQIINNLQNLNFKTDQRLLQKWEKLSTGF